MSGAAPAHAGNLARRHALLAQLPSGALAIVPTAPTVSRNSDCDYPYRHCSYFYYLSGFAEPDAVLVLVGAGAGGPARSLLFCRERNPERELWEGPRHGLQGARAQFGFDDAYPIDELDAAMTTLMRQATALYTRAADAALSAQIRQWLHGAPAGIAHHDLASLLDEMRLFKDPSEQALMARAADVSAQAHRRAMANTRPGMHEYQIEAELLYEFRRHGAQAPAYQSIVASGANACVLHYGANRGLLRDGELVLIDAGCELDGYAADISRTYPANGRFSPAQRALYQVVLAAQQAALTALAPGRSYQAIHDAALQVLAQGMLDLRLLDGNLVGRAQDVIANGQHLQFYMHGTGHWLGLDVHDVGSYHDPADADALRALQPGMVLTVEPGLYVRPAAGVPEAFWNIGIRIEDDVLVTATGHTVLSDGAPKTIDDIEQLMAGAA